MSWRPQAAMDCTAAAVAIDRVIKGLETDSFFPLSEAPKLRGALQTARTAVKKLLDLSESLQPSDDGAVKAEEA